MTKFLLRRVPLGLLVMLLVTVAVFAIFYIGPGPDAVARKLAGHAAPQSTVDLIKDRLGLNKPIWTQYWYFLWGNGSQHGLLRGNLGTDYYNGVSVNSEIQMELPISLSLIIGAAFLWLLMGTVSGLISAIRPRSFADRAFTMLALFFYSIPTFVLGLLVLLVFFYVLTVHGLAIFPASGYVPLTQDPWQWFRHLLLPWFTLAAVSAAVYTRLTRGAMLDVLGEDYIRTARSKGLSEKRVIFLHSARPASSPIISQFGIDLGGAIGGISVIEKIFGLPGLGYNALNAVATQDLPEIIGITIVGSFAVVLANMLADVAYAWIDPRVRMQ